jgi:GTP cyclohydrolase I
MTMTAAHAHLRGVDALDEGDDLDETLTRSLSDTDRARFERYIAEIFEAAGLDLDTPGTSATPHRFLQALFDATEGYEGDPKLLTAFPTECHGGTSCELAQIVEGPIPFYSLCEHHAMPFYGRAYVAYVAHDQIIGISKLTRLVRVLTRRFGVQERMTHQIADELMRLMNAHGVAVYLEAHHLCTQMRGVREERSKSVMTFWRGSYSDDPDLRREFLATVGNHLT